MNTNPSRFVDKSIFRGIFSFFKKKLIKAGFFSYGGAAYGCGCLPYGKSTHDKQRWFEDHMFKWRAENVHRTRAIPHIKTYTKVHEGKVGYFVLTRSGH